jgi:type II secretory pathway pseudopilin PulG
MSPTTKKRLSLLIAVVGGAVLAFFAARLWSNASRAAEESAQRALMEEAGRLLAAYQREHGAYPESLDALELTYPDGGDASTLASFQYNSDGEHYVLLGKGASTGAELRVCK